MSTLARQTLLDLIRMYGYIRENGLDLQYDATEELQGNKFVVRAAIRQNPLALQYASDELKAAPDIKAIVARKD